MNVILFRESEWGQILDPRDPRSEHLRRILGPREGDSVRVALLDTGEGQAVFRGWQGESPVLEFPDPARLVPAAPLVPLELVLGHPRPLVFQRLLKDLNSLGVARIQATATRLGDPSYLKSSVWKDNAWQEFLIQGAQQGGLSRLSRLDRRESFPEALAALPEASFRICLDLEPGSPLFLDWCAESLPDLPRPSVMGPSLPLVLSLGPERGWADSERRLMADAGFVTMGLGPSILRTEMACMLAAGMAAMVLGRSRPVPPGQGRQ